MSFVVRDHVLVEYRQDHDRETEIEIPEGVRIISGQAFRKDGFRLRAIRFPAGLQEIEDNAFSGAGLERAILPEGLVRIGNYAFSRCSSLKSVSVPHSVQRIGAHAFERCEALSFVRFPAGLQDCRQARHRGGPLRENPLLPGLTEGDASFLQGNNAPRTSGAGDPEDRPDCFGTVKGKGLEIRILLRISGRRTAAGRRFPVPVLDAGLL